MYLIASYALQSAAKQSDLENMSEKTPLNSGSDRHTYRFNQGKFCSRVFVS